MQNTTKNRIDSIVSDYKGLFTEEYSLVCDMLKHRKSDLRNEFAELKNVSALKRGLYEIPETLSEMLIKQLSENEMAELKTKTGGRWFAKKFKEFSLPNRQ